MSLLLSDPVLVYFEDGLKILKALDARPIALAYLFGYYNYYCCICFMFYEFIVFVLLVSSNVLTLANSIFTKFVLLLLCVFHKVLKLLNRNWHYMI